MILRTYASRPVSQGRVCGGPRAPAPLHSFLERALAVGPGSPFAAFLPGSSQIFAESGTPTALWTWTDSTQSLDVDFSSLESSINAQDGVLAVFTFTLDPSLAPGTTYDFQINPGESFLQDPNGQPIPIDVRSGRVRVRSAGTNPSLSLGAPKVHPGSAAALEIETAEPFALASGHLEIYYDPTIASGPPTVTANPRHGPVATTVSTPAPGQVTIDFTSSSPWLNAQVPGALFTVEIPTLTTNPVGSQSWVQFGAGTFLVAPGPNPRPVNLPGDWIEFVASPAIWGDGFESGSLWVWSRHSP